MFAIALALFFPSTVLACQESCIVYSVRALQGAVRNADGKDVARATLRVRKASSTTIGPSAFCGTRKGRIVKEVRTDKQGRFKVMGLKDGVYWVTYLHKVDGESFLLRIGPQDGDAEPVWTLNSWGGRCYLVDVERNVTKPSGWPAPVLKESQ
jgi:hypothetical protein